MPKRIALTLASLLVIYGLVWLYLSLPPVGVKPIKNVNIATLEGPWFQVATSMPDAANGGSKAASLFFKFSGPGGDRLPAVFDPENPKFHIVLFESEGGARSAVLDTETYIVKDFLGGSVHVPCGWGLRCGLHLVGYDRKDHLWMIVGSPNRHFWWIFSRVPGLSMAAKKDVENRIKALGLSGEVHMNREAMPAIPEILPSLPESLPPVPGVSSAP